MLVPSFLTCRLRVFAVAQQLSGHVISRIMSRHFEKLTYLDTSILNTTIWFCDRGKDFLPFIFNFVLAGTCFLLYPDFLGYLADQECLPAPLKRTGLGCSGSQFLSFLALQLPLLTLTLTSALLASGFLCWVPGSSAFSPSILPDGKEQWYSFSASYCCVPVTMLS